MVGDANKNLIATAMFVVLLYLGLVMAIFYGVKGEWKSVIFCLLASGVAFYCKKKNDKKGY